MTPCPTCSHMSSALYCPSCGTRRSLPPAGKPAAAGGVVRVYEGPEAVLVQAAPWASQPVAMPSSAPAVRSRCQVETHDIRKVSGNLHQIKPGGVTTTALHILDQSDERMAWSETPSPVLLLPLGLKYLAAIAVLTYGTGNLYVVLAMLMAAGIHAGLRLLAIQGTVYRLSSQRLEVTAGLWNQTTVTYENFRLGDAVIVRPLYLRIFQYANVHIAGAPILTAIRRPEVVRDILREFGQTEASRTDKIRWRQ